MDSLIHEANAIAQHYIDSLPADYASRYSAISDATTLDALFRAIRAGQNDASACKTAGMSPDTLQRWLKRANDEPDSAFAAFAEVLTRVREERKTRLLERIETHGSKDWRADAWLLERTDQDQFALKRGDADVRIGVQVQVNMPGCEQAKQIASTLPVLTLSPSVSVDTHNLTDDN